GLSSIVLTSNQADYGPADVRHDLHVIRKWAGDLNQLSTTALMDETVAAIMSAAARYYPELPTRAICRMIMADIKAESDFDTNNVSGGRLDSGSSWGLMQVSPDGGSQELKLFKDHVVTSTNDYSWEKTVSSSHAGPLLDWKTGKEMKVSTLTNQDLFRPWINIHMASWIQSNLARTSSQDPYDWTAISKASVKARNSTLAQQANPNSASLSKTATSAWDKVKTLLVGSGLPRSLETGLGSWVAGPAMDGEGSYKQDGDEISDQYLITIAESLTVLYGNPVGTDWLGGLLLNAGLVDFKA
ncbi:hypothetical protein IE53DRAFT_314930, partial [Violaceomyces palustris]